MKPSVQIELDKIRNLRFTTNAFVKLEELLGKSIIELFANPVRTGMTGLRAMLWVGLIHEDSALTLEQVGNMMDGVDIEEMGKKLGEAFDEAMTTKKKTPDLKIPTEKK